MTTVPPPPWRQPNKKSGPPRRTLNQSAILDAAMRIVDAEGIDALSMRRVAQALDTGPASLYAHVRNKEELLQLLLDRAQEGIPRPEPDPDRWQDQIKEVLRAARAQLAAHRDLARAADQVPLGANSLINTETMLAVLRAGGLPPQAIAYAVDTLALYVVATVVEDAARDQRMGHVAEPERSKLRTEYTGKVRDYFASLPEPDFPNTRALASELTRDVGDERFEFGLDLLVSGLARHAGD
ncbi:TetR/AcrR family transcriptional regulator [Streptomyces sp. A7024]|uniref:TetR/AcrR family transcriptional regulator n=1 Tax=Streptomyces coryli TaxID=1128680 RepID=A0A6G4TZF4_9ACTN|nr:TetR/AcrR family transcriptional regulator [Streptomyces coryli]NGN64836.1 TetR/AcrR family transcriptional regulator [Streptomyces coryli]